MGKLKFMDKLKMHKHAIALGVSVIIIACSFACIFAMQDGNTFYLRDLEGDRDALSDLLITGYLQDKYHGLKFQVTKGNLTHEFIYYKDKNDMYMPPVIYVNGAADAEFLYSFSFSYKIADDANTQVEYSEDKIQVPLENGYTLEATEIITRTYADKIDVYMDINKNWLQGKRGKEIFPGKNRLKFKTGVSITRDNMDFVFESKKVIYPDGGSSEQPAIFRSPDLVSPYRNTGFALATLGGRQYFTVIEQGNKQTGENGIFTAVEYVDDIDVLTRNDYGKVEKLVSFDLEKENIQMLGLHAVEDNLAAVMLVDNILTFRVYDPQDGKLLAELAVPEFEMSGPREGSSKNQGVAAGDAHSTDNSANSSTGQGTGQGTSMGTSQDTSQDTSIGTSMDTSMGTSQDTSIGTSMDTSMATGDAEDWIQYTPYIHGNTLSLSITRLNQGNYQNGITIFPGYLNIVSVKISTANSAGNSIDTDDPNSNSNSNINYNANNGKSAKIDLLHCISDFRLNNLVVTGIPAVAAVNNKLAVFAVLREEQTNEAHSSTPAKISQINEFLYPVHFNIFVFDSAENPCRLLYSGEIVTDADDDSKVYRYAFKDYYGNSDSYQSGILYSIYDHNENRNIGLVTIREVSNGVSNEVSNGASNQVSNWVSNWVLNRVLNGVSNRVSSEVSNRASNRASNGVSNGVSNQVLPRW